MRGKGKYSCMGNIINKINHGHQLYNMKNSGIRLVDIRRGPSGSIMSIAYWIMLFRLWRGWRKISLRFDNDDHKSNGFHLILVSITCNLQAKLTCTTTSSCHVTNSMLFCSIYLYWKLECTCEQSQFPPVRFTRRSIMKMSICDLQIG